MSNLEKYNQVFCKVFSLPVGFDGVNVRLNDTPDWDSVGHMELVTELEDTFDIMFETEDILNFASYTEGIELLKKYAIEL